MVKPFKHGTYVKLIRDLNTTGSEKGRVYQVDNQNMSAKDGKLVLRKISKQDGEQLKRSVKSNTLVLFEDTFDSQGYYIKNDGSRGQKYFKKVSPKMVDEVNGETRGSKAVNSMMR